MSLLRLAEVLPVGRFLRNCLDALYAAYPASLLGLPRVMGVGRRSLNYFQMVREVNDQPNDQPFRYGVCKNSLAFLLSNSNLSAFQFSFTPGVRWAATPRSTISVSCPP